MGQFVHKFNTIAEYNIARKGKYKRPWTSYVIENKEVKFNKTAEEIEEEERALQTPLTFEITGDGNIVWKTSDTASTKTIMYKLNDGEWTSITSTTEGISISVVAGNTLQFRGDNATYGTPYYNNSFSGSTAQFKVKGNIMSLISSTDFSGLTTLESDYTFSSLFHDCTGLTNASELLLPATTLAYLCYFCMFQGCTSLTSTPELPAITLADSCYNGMFKGCTSLTQAPSLPATTLASECYMNMFSGCTSLTTAPQLPATTLANYCYSNMFTDCTSLTTAPELPATTLANYCYNKMFYGCTSLTTAPELLTTTLAEGCYDRMFLECTNLNYIKCLATNISANNYTSYWVYNVASTGTFVKATGVNWSTGNHGIPSGWTIIEAS